MPFGVPCAGQRCARGAPPHRPACSLTQTSSPRRLSSRDSSELFPHEGERGKTRMKLVLNAKAPSFSFFLIKNLIQLAKTPPRVSEENSRWQWLLSRRSLGDGETTRTPGRLTWSHFVPLVLLEALQRVHSGLQPSGRHAQPHRAVAGF